MPRCTRHSMRSGSPRSWPNKSGMKNEPRWILSLGEELPESAKLSGDICGLPCIARLLQRKGFLTDEETRDFLRPRLARLSDPFLLPNMRLAVDRILTA